MICVIKNDVGVGAPITKGIDRSSAEAGTWPRAALFGELGNGISRAIKANESVHGQAHPYPQKLCVDFWVDSFEVGVWWDDTFLQCENCFDHAG